MPSLTDCYSCECLIAASESRCPFCGASQRNATAPSWLAVGITLGLTFGLGTLSCAGDDGESTMTTTQDPSGNADAVTYGGPDSLSDSGTTDVDTGTTTDTTTTTTTDSTTTTTTTTTTGTSTTDGTSTSTTNDSSNADAVTYGGPDSLTDTDWTASDS